MACTEPMAYEQLCSVSALGDVCPFSLFATLEFYTLATVLE